MRGDGIEELTGEPGAVEEDVRDGTVTVGKSLTGVGDRIMGTWAALSASSTTESIDERESIRSDSSVTSATMSVAPIPPNERGNVDRGVLRCSGA